MQSNKLSSGLLNTLQPPSIRNAAEYSEREILLPEGDSHAGSWYNRPYQVEILKAMSMGSRMKANQHPIREVVLLKSAQVGYSCMILISLSYHVIYKPTNIGLYQPSRDSAVAYGTNQLGKFIEAQPSLVGKISSAITADGKSSGVRKHFEGGTLRVLAANKTADVASHTFGLVYVDECDLIKADVGGEGDPVELIRNRTNEYHDHLICYGSTPRGSFKESRIWSLYQSSDRRRYYMRCPKCNREQYLAWKQFQIGESDYNESGFLCIDPRCNFLMKEVHKLKMIREGRWKPTSKEGTPGRAGYHVFCALSDSPTVSWPALARMRDDMGYTREKVISFQNTKLGLPARPSDYSSIVATDVLENLKSGYMTIMGNKGIPNEVSLLTAGVDVQTSQGGRLEYTLWGWHRKQVYYIRHAAIAGDPQLNEVWDMLNETLCIPHYSEDGTRTLTPAVVAIDSGDGNTSHRVYERTLARRRNGWVPVKGHGVFSKTAVVTSNTPNSRQPLLMVNTIALKDRIRGLLKTFTSGDPSAELHLPEDIEPYVIEGWLSEYRTTKINGDPTWVYNSVHRNEPLDTFVYAMAAMIHYTGYYDADVVWPALERRAMGITAKRKPKSRGPEVDFGGFV